MGVDPYTRQDYSHRRQWVLDRLARLASCFAIDVGFTAVMSNHLHLVLRTFPRLAKRWSHEEVARRWLRAFPGKRVLDGKRIEPTEQQVEALARDKRKIKRLRKRLSNISWFMSGLSEYAARRANKEDDVSGRFWQGRFSCREIACEPALLVCGAYVDLNQIRAGEVSLPHEAAFSSIGLRLRDVDGGWLPPLTLSPTEIGDAPCATGQRILDKGLLPLSLEQYTRLLDWTAGQVGQDEPAEATEAPRATLPAAEQATLDGLGINPQQWLTAVRDFPRLFRRMAGRASDLAERARQIGRRCLQGGTAAAEVFR